MKVWCPADEEIIPRTETVRGYEWAPDQYVVITDEDLEKVPLATMRTIEIHQFVRARDRRLRARRGSSSRRTTSSPIPIGRKAFALLKSVLADKELTAIAKIVIKDREDLAALDPFGPTMLLTTIKWPDEIRPISELDLPKEEPEFRPAERKMAEQLVAAMTDEFDPEDYHDEYHEALLKVIEAKVEGKETVEAPEAEEPTNLVDLMAALEASVAATKAARDGKQKPVSVDEARERSRSARRCRGREARGRGRPSPRSERPRPATRRPSAPKQARPARRRKSA